MMNLKPTTVETLLKLAAGQPVKAEALNMRAVSRAIIEGWVTVYPASRADGRYIPPQTRYTLTPAGRAVASDLPPVPPMCDHRYSTKRQPTLFTPRQRTGKPWLPEWMKERSRLQ